jgi:hypothetical protein
LDGSTREGQPKSGKPQKVIVTKERTVLTYSELWHASSRVLKIGLEQPSSSSWQFLSSAILTAFAFEAYLNHVGEQIALTDWNIVESCPPIEKFEHLCKALSVAFPDGKGKRPLQTIVELFEFRKALAHGKTKIAMEGPATRDVNDRLDGDLGKRPTLH